jgi:Flp pilus assembly protein TadG
MTRATSSSTASPVSLWRRLSAFGCQSGQAALEMAVALPVFLLLVFGVAQCSFLLMTYCNATYACRNAARYAALHSSTSLLPASSTQIRSMVQSGLILSASITPTITVNYVNSNLGAGTNDIGNMVLVQVTWSQGLIIPFSSARTLTVGTHTYRPITR